MKTTARILVSGLLALGAACDGDSRTASTPLAPPPPPQSLLAVEVAHLESSLPSNPHISDLRDIRYSARLRFQAPSGGTIRVQPIVRSIAFREGREVEDFVLTDLSEARFGPGSTEGEVSFRINACQLMSECDSHLNVTFVMQVAGVEAVTTEIDYLLSEPGLVQSQDDCRNRWSGPPSSLCS